MFRKFASLAVLALIAVLVAPFLVLAQDGTSVNAGGFFEIVRPYIVELASVVIAFFVAWLSAKFSKLTGLQIEQRHRDALQSALQNGANYGINKAGGYAASLSVDVKSEALAEGIRYVQRSVPDALKFFGIDQYRIRELLEAKFPTPLVQGEAIVGQLGAFDGPAQPHA